MIKYLKWFLLIALPMTLVSEAIAKESNSCNILGRNTDSKNEIIRSFFQRFPHHVKVKICSPEKIQQTEIYLISELNRKLDSIYFLERQIYFIEKDKKLNGKPHYEWGYKSPNSRLLYESSVNTYMCYSIGKERCEGYSGGFVSINNVNAIDFQKIMNLFASRSLFRRFSG